MITLVLYIGSLPNLTTLFQIIFIVTVTLTFDLNDPKINRVLSLPQGNHVVQFGKDPRCTILSEFCIIDKNMFVFIVGQMEDCRRSGSFD
jgi:hypothetical protein